MSTVNRAVAMCGLEEGNVVKLLAKADRMRPAYCIALRPDRRQAEPFPSNSPPILQHCYHEAPTRAFWLSEDD